MKNNIKVFWEIETRTEGDYYEDEQGHECQGSPIVSRRIEVEEKHTSEIKDIFEQEDGDWDFTNSVLLITDTKGKILFDPKVKIAYYSDNWDLYDKWSKEKDPFRKAQYSEELIKSIQERQRLYGKDRDRRQEAFIEWCKYQNNEEGDTNE